MGGAIFAPPHQRSSTGVLIEEGHQTWPTFVELEWNSDELWSA